MLSEIVEIGENLWLCTDSTTVAVWICTPPTVWQP